jgi:hypothetical protein
MGDDDEKRSSDPRYDWIRTTVQQHFVHINEAKFDKSWDTEEQL